MQELDDDLREWEPREGWQDPMWMTVERHGLPVLFHRREACSVPNGRQPAPETWSQIPVAVVEAAFERAQQRPTERRQYGFCEICAVRKLRS